MKVEVIGYKGVVGGATYELMKRLGYEVSGSDKGDEVGRADIYFVCVPEDVVEEVVYHCIRAWDRPSIVIRSSVPQEPVELLPGEPSILISVTILNSSVKLLLCKMSLAQHG